MPDMQKLQPCQTSFVLPAELHPPGNVHRVPADCFGAHRGDHNGFNCPGLSLRLRDRVLDWGRSDVSRATRDLRHC